MTIPRLPAQCFPNNVLVRLSDDTIGREGAARPNPGAGVLLAASVQDKGASWDSGRMASVARYRVSFRDDPNLSLARPLLGGDQIEVDGLILSVLAPRANRGGMSWVWRVDCEHIRQ